MARARWMVSAAAVLVLVAALAWSEDWPQFRGAKLDNVSGSTGLVDKFLEGGPKIVWETKVAGSTLRDVGVFASPVVAGGRVFVYGRKYAQDTTTKATKFLESPDILYALDAKTGKALWQQEFKPRAYYPDKTCWNSPLVEGEMVYARGPDGEQRCLNAADGKLVWSWPKDPAELDEFVKGKGEKHEGKKSITGYGLSAPSVIVGDMLILPAWGGFQARLYGLDKKTGEVKWQTPDYGCWQFSAGCMAPMEVGGKKVVAIGSRVLDPNTGKDLTAEDPKNKGRFLGLPGGIEWVPAFAGNKLIVSVRKDIKYPTTEEADAAKKEFPKAPNFADGVQCISLTATPDGVIEAKQDWALLERDGKTTKGYGGAIVAGDAAYMFLGYGSSNYLVCLNLADGKKLWALDLKSQLGYANAIYADGKIYWAWGGVLSVLPVSPKGPGELSSVQVTGGSWATPALADGLMYLRDDAGTVKCLDLHAKLTPAAVTPSAVAGGDWPQVDGPLGNGSTADKGLLEEIPKDGLKAAWSAPTEPGTAGPIVAGGKVFVLGQKSFGLRKDKDGAVVKDKDGKPARDAGAYSSGEGPAILYALDRATGKEAWQYAFKPVVPPPPPDKNVRYVWPVVPPVADGDKVYALAGQNELVCLNAADGKPAWAVEVEGGATADYRPGPVIRLLVVGDALVVSRGGSYQPNVLTAVDKSTGATRWSKYFATGNNNEISPRVLKLAGGEALAEACPVWLSVLAADSTPLAALEAPKLEPVPNKDPKQPPTPRWENFNTNGYATAGNRLLVYRDKFLDAYDVAADGGATACKKAWSAETKALGAKLIVAGDRVFQVSGGSVAATELAGGKPLWTGQAGINATGAVAADGKVILIGGPGDIALIKADAAEFKLLSKGKILETDAIWSAPALSNGQLFIRDCTGAVKCVDLKAAK